MKNSYILYPDLTSEEVTPENGRFTETELKELVGPARVDMPLSFSEDTFTIDDEEGSEQLNCSDYTLIVDASGVGEPNASAAVLVSDNEIYGTALLALNDHL